MPFTGGFAGNFYCPGSGGCGSSRTSGRQVLTCSAIVLRCRRPMHPSLAGARYGGGPIRLRADMSRDTNFYYSFLVLPPEKRRAIVAVWDFCRAVDDSVDEAGWGEPARTQIARWRNELAAVFDGGTPQTSQGLALAPFVPAFNLPRSAFEALIEGVEMD